MRSKTKVDNTAMRGDENGIHRAAVQLKPGDAWYDPDDPSIYILLSTSPWTFLVSSKIGQPEVPVPGGLGTESYILYLFERSEKIG